MTTCPKCNKWLADGAKFCDACGAQVLGTAASAKSVKKKSPPKKKAVLFSGIGIILLAAAALAVFHFFINPVSSKYALYLKGGKMYYTDCSKDEALKVTPRLSDNDSGVSLVWKLRYYTTFNSSGTRVFFPDKLDDSSSIRVTLYYRDTNKPNKDAVRIDSDISDYAINESGTEIVYKKGSDNILYYNNLNHPTDKKKLASGVESFFVADDFKKFGYTTDENDFYLWYTDEDPVKLISDYTSFGYAASNLSELYYTKDGTLYKQPGSGGSPEEIASDISQVIVFCPDGIYYSRSEATQVALADYVEDDMAAADASMAEPAYPDYPDAPKYPSWWSYDTTEEYEAAVAQYESDYETYEATCDQLRADYDAAYELYQGKEARNSLRKDLMNATVDLTKYSLYYYDGVKETLVTDSLSNDTNVAFTRAQSVLIFSTFNQEKMQKLKLSEINFPIDSSLLIYDALVSSSSIYVAVGPSLSALACSNNTYYDFILDFHFTSDGSAFYFMDDISDEGNGTLYKIPIVNGQVGMRENVDSDVDQQSITLTADDKPLYCKNVEYFESYDSEPGSYGDLFIDGEAIDYDVRFWSYDYMDGAVLYYTDWDPENSYGTLKMFRNGSKTKIADNVYDFTVVGDSDIIYLHDYSTDSCAGTLSLYNNGKPKELDHDVAALVPVYEYVGKGSSYYYGW